MEETKNTRAIVLYSQPYKEVDSLVNIYSQDFGRLNLIARGTKKLSSKLAGHLEPMSEIRLMIIKGRFLDYVGGVVMTNSFFSIRDDLNKLFYTGKMFALFSSLVKEGEKDERLFNLLKKYLEAVDEELEFDKEKGELFFVQFALSFLKEMGYAPEMNNCLYCHKKLLRGNNYFNLLDGGVFCDKCHISQKEIDNKHILTISDSCVIVIRQLLYGENKIKLSAKKKTLQEILDLVNKFTLYLK